MTLPSTWSLKTLLRLCFVDKKRLFNANFLAVLATLVTVPLPLLMPLLVDGVLLSPDNPSMGWLDSWLPETWQQPTMYILVVLISVLVLRIIALGLNVAHTRLYSTLATDLSYQLRGQLLTKLGKLSIYHHQQSGSGALSANLLTDIDTLHQFISTGISRVGVAGLTLIGTGVVLLWLHPVLGITILLLNPLIVLLSRTLGGRVKHLKTNENQAVSRFQQRALELLDGIYSLRASGRDKYFLEKLDSDASVIRDTSNQFAWQSDAMNRASFLLYMLGFELFRGLAMVMVLTSSLTLGEMFAVFGYLWFLLTPVQELIGVQYSAFAAKAALSRINGLLALEEEVRPEMGMNPFQSGVPVSIDIQHVHFGYDEQNRVLNGLDMSLTAGDSLAVTGVSGGGKSTLIHLLLGFYQPSSGKILFNGVSLDRIDRDALHQAVAVVPQHPTLFNDTLRMNLTLGQSCSDDDLWEALSLAQLSSFVQELPDGLDTVLGNHGSRLSGGQRQRLAIARLLLTDPSMVIFDEATSALDVETEMNLHQALKHFLAQRTVLIVAHRQSALEQADKFVVLDEGVVVNQGVYPLPLTQVRSA